MKYGGRERCRASVLLLVKPPGSGVHPSPCWEREAAPGASRELVLLAVPSVWPLPPPKKRQQSVPCSSPTGTLSCGTELQVVLKHWPPPQLLAGLGGGSGDKGTRRQGDKGKGPSGWLAQGTQLGDEHLSWGWKLSLLDLGASRTRAQANRPSPNEMQAHQ